MVRPWTRLEGARLVAEAHSNYFDMDEVGESLLASLDKEYRSQQGEQCLRFFNWNWFLPQNKAGIFYRKMVSDAALLGGGSNTDFGADASWRIRPQIELNALGQFERWNFPLLQQTSRSNFTGSLEIRMYPAARLHGRRAR